MGPLCVRVWLEELAFGEYDWVSMGHDIHPEEGGGSVLAEFGLGDGVAVEREWSAPSFFAFARERVARWVLRISEEAYLGPYWLL